MGLGVGRPIGQHLTNAIFPDLRHAYMSGVSFISRCIYVAAGYNYRQGNGVMRPIGEGLGLAVLLKHGRIVVRNGVQLRSNHVHIAG